MEVTIASADKDSQVSLTASRNEVERTVEVEIGGGQSERVRTCRQLCSRRKRGVAGVEQHVDVVAMIVDHGKVDRAVFVEVGCNDSGGGTPDGPWCWCGESTR